MEKNKPNTRFSLSCMSSEQFNGIVSTLQYSLSGGLRLDRSRMLELAESVKVIGPLESREIQFPVLQGDIRKGYCGLEFSTELHLGHRYAHVAAKPRYEGSNGVATRFDDRVRRTYAEPFDNSRSFELQLRKSGVRV